MRSIACKICDCCRCLCSDFNSLYSLIPYQRTVPEMMFDLLVAARRPALIIRQFLASPTSRRGLQTVSIAKAVRLESVDKQVEVTGWVQSARVQKQYSFMQMNDGSSVQNLQIVWPSNGAISMETAQQLGPGCSVSVKGKIVASPKPAQPVEMHADDVVLHGTADALRYPLLQKKMPSLEYLRDVAHIRPRTPTFGAILRARHTITMGIHDFFDSQGFYNVNTPIMTANDCEGAGELFSVSAARVSQAKEGGDAVQGASTAQAPQGGLPPSFFDKPVYLTVSGQLHLEPFACALRRVYTLGPTFRAENSHTSRHLAEFWMLEPEMAPASVHDAMNLAESCVRHVSRYYLARRSEEVQYLAGVNGDTSLLDRVTQLASDRDFVRISYTEAIKLLRKSKQSFKYPVRWEDGLATEHERWLCESYFKGPVFVQDYPAAIKPFYMRQNEWKQGGEEPAPTVASFDLLVPKIGELIGGSAREERYKLLSTVMRDKGLLSPQVRATLSTADKGRATSPAETDNGYLDWYLDTRKYGTLAHAGWGLGMERLVMLLTGTENIRDVVPIPRTPGSCRM